MRKIKIALLLSFSAILLAGCVVGPEYKRPKEVLDKDASFINSNSQSKKNVDYAPDKWWVNFADDTTAELVDIALKNNQNLKASAARVIQAQARYKFVSGAKLGRVDYNFNADRSKRTPDSIASVQNSYTHYLSASYVVDIFGKLERNNRAAWDDILSAEYSRKALVQGLIAEVVSTRVAIAYINKQLQISKDNTKSWDKTYKVIKRRYNNGLTSSLDLRLARENLATSRAQEKVYEQLLNETMYKLDVLLGRNSSTYKELPKLDAPLPMIGAVSASIPAKLLDRRPDLMAMEMKLSGATERVGVSMANLYPDLTLTGTYGYSSGSFDKLTRPGFDIYSLVGGAVMPLFRGGQLKAQVEISEAIAQEMAANYASAVLNAVREVESALMRERVLREKLVNLNKSLVESQASEKLATQRYLRGLESIVTVLDAQRRKRVSQLEVTKALAQIWQARIDLYLALGGDWQGESEVAKKQAKNL